MIPKNIYFVWIDNKHKHTTIIPKVWEYCIMSAQIFNPDYKIIIYTNNKLESNMLDLSSIKNIIINDELYDEAISIGILPANKRFNSWNMSHFSDWIRYTTLYKNGGIYLDTDIICLTNFDKFLNEKFVIGTEVIGINSAFIMSEPNFGLIKDVINGYLTDYRKEDWTYNAMKVLENNADNYDIKIIPRKEGFCYPSLNANERGLYYTACENTDLIGKLFTNLGHHLSGHAKSRSTNVIKDFENSNSDTYIAKLRQFIVNKYMGVK